MFIKNRCESKSDITSEESFSHSQNSNVQSQDSLYTEIEPDSFLQKNLNQRNKSVPLFKIYNTEKVCYFLHSLYLLIFLMVY